MGEEVPGGRSVGTQLRDAPSVLVHAGRVLWAHWPALLVIYLLGQAVRGAALWAAVVVSGWNPTAGAFLVPFAPLATLSALILSLRAVSPSLRYATFDPAATSAGATAGRGGLVRERLALLASTLVPFLAVYAAQGYLAEDQFAFVNEAVADEFLNNADFWLSGGTLDAGRAAVADGWWFAALVAVALVLRRLLDRFGMPARGTGWGLLAAYVEVAWVTLLATGFATQLDQWRAWVEQRRFVAAVHDGWLAATSVLGPLADPVRDAVSWLWAALGDVDSLVVVPLAWLTVGAVVYGRSLTRADALDASDPRVERWRARVARVPAPVRRAGTEVLGGVWDRFRGLASGIRTLALAGLVPMLLFCLVFAVAGQAEVLTAVLLQRAIGPQDPNTMVAFVPYVGLASRAVYTVLLVALLAAAVDRVMQRTGRTEAPVGGEVSVRRAG